MQDTANLFREIGSKITDKENKKSKVNKTTEETK